MDGRMDGQIGQQMGRQMARKTCRLAGTRHDEGRRTQAFLLSRPSCFSSRDSGPLCCFLMSEWENGMKAGEGVTL